MDTQRRSSNWSKDEVIYLIQRIEERKNVIKGKFGPNLTIKNKREAWQEITDALNAAYPRGNRSVAQVEKKWQNIASKGKNDIHARKRLYNQTG